MTAFSFLASTTVEASESEEILPPSMTISTSPSSSFNASDTSSTLGMPERFALVLDNGKSTFFNNSSTKAWSGIRNPSEESLPLFLIIVIVLIDIYPIILA